VAQIRPMTLVGPTVIGVISAGGEIVAENRAVRKAAEGLPDNLFLDNLETIADLAGGSYAVLNHSLDLGFPRQGQGAQETFGAGVAILSKRAVRFIGGNLFELGGAALRPSRAISGAARHRRLSPGGPGASVSRPSVPVEGERRQFFSVT